MKLRDICECVCLVLLCDLIERFSEPVLVMHLCHEISKECSLELLVVDGCSLLDVRGLGLVCEIETACQLRSE